MKTRLGRLLREHREAQGWTQWDVMERSDWRLKQDYLSQVENGKIGRPRDPKLRELAEAYGLPLEQVQLAMAGFEEVVFEEEIEVRIIGMVPADSVRWTAASEEARTVPVPKAVLARASYPLVAVEVSGDCLEGRSIRDGDVVVLEQVTEVTHIRNGEIVALRVGDEFTLKVWQLRGRTITLCDGAGNVVRVLEPAEEYEIIGVARYRGGTL